MNIPFLNFSSPLTAILLVVLLGVLVVILILLSVTSGRRRRRVSARPHPQLTRSRSMTGRHDHGAEIASKHGHARSPEWERVEREHRLREPACVACGYKGKGLQVHHIHPFHLHPELELDQNNLITLCEVKGRDHHLLLGHLDEWESYNKDVRADATGHFHRKTEAQIRAHPLWLKKVQNRPMP